MDEVRNKLTQQDRAHLSNLWEDKDTLHSIGNALSRQQLILQHQGVTQTTDFNQVMYMRGQNDGLDWFIKFLKYNHSEIKKNKKATQAQGGTVHSQ